MSGPSQPALAEAIRAVLEDETADWLPMLPGIVQSYDRETRRATVLPAIRRVYEDGAADRPVIPDVPVAMLSGAGAEVEIDLAQGDMVLLLCGARDLSAWRDAPGAVSTPRTSRAHALSDAVAMPFKATGANAVRLRLRDGKVYLGSATVDVVDILLQALTALSTATAGPFPLSTNGVIADLAADIATLKEI